MNIIGAIQLAITLTETLVRIAEGLQADQLTPAQIEASKVRAAKVREQFREWARELGVEPPENET